MIIERCKVQHPRPFYRPGEKAKNFIEYKTTDSCLVMKRQPAGLLMQGYRM